MYILLKNSLHVCTLLILHYGKYAVFIYCMHVGKRSWLMYAN